MKVEIIETLSHQDEAHLTPHGHSTCQAKRFDEREEEIGFVNIFHQNSNTFYTRNILYPPLVPTYYFPLAHILLFFEHAFTHNSHYYLFGRIIINTIVYGRKRKTCIVFYIRKRKTCIIFGRKNK